MGLDPTVDEEDPAALAWNSIHTNLTCSPKVLPGCVWHINLIQLATFSEQFLTFLIRLDLN